MAGRALRKVAILTGVLPVLALGQQCEAARTISLLTYNIHAGIPMGSKSSEYTVTDKDLANVADVITSSGADIVALQEVHCEFMLRDPEKRHSSALNEPRLLSGLTGLSYVFASTLSDAKGLPANTDYIEWGTLDRWTNNGGKHGEYGNCVLSRFGFAVPPGNVALPRKDKKQEQRAFVRVALKDKAAEGIVVYAAHLHHENSETPTRVTQMERIMQHASGEKRGTTVFVIGDFNADAETTGAPVLAVAQRHGFFDLAAEQAHEQSAKPAPTYPADTPKLRLDYVLCNRRVHVEEVRVIDTLVSDHRPLLVRVRMD
jgi:endonuclease/exonuclease/phosphatase family metal-dependent hydrolase